MRYWLCLLALALFPIMSAHAETNDVEIIVVDGNNDQVNPWGLNVFVYPAGSDIPVFSLEQPFNPVSISLENGKYAIHVYRHDMFVGYYFVTLDSSEQIQIPIADVGGTVFQLYYADMKPLNNAKVEIFSHTGTKWAESISGTNGKTERFWLQIPQGTDEYYSATVSLDEDISYIIPKFRFGGGYNQENIVTPWNSIVADPLNIQLYKTHTKPISKYDGKFIVELYNNDNEKVITSKIGDHGESHLSNIPTGYYFLRVLKLPEDDSSEPILWTVERLLIRDGMDKIKIFSSDNADLDTIFSNSDDNVPKIESPDETCNCVAFRIDNLQDYYLVDVQQELIDLFVSKNVPVTVGVIGKNFGNDLELTNFLKSTISDHGDLIAIGNHGGVSNVAAMNLSEQISLIQNTNDGISDSIGVKPTVFIPPFGSYNHDTITALEHTGMKYVSSVSSSDLPPYSFNSNSVLRFPSTTASAYVEPGLAWHGIPASQTFNDIKFSIRDYGFAVVLLHPHEYSERDGWIFKNQLDVTQYFELSQLIDEVNSKGLKIVAIDEIDSEVIHIDNRFPKWFKNSVLWWTENKTDDSSFFTSIEYLVREQVIRVPQTERNELMGTNVLLEFKNNARLWAQGALSDDVFIDDIQILIKQGIIEI